MEILNYLATLTVLLFQYETRVLFHTGTDRLLTSLPTITKGILDQERNRAII